MAAGKTRKISAASARILLKFSGICKKILLVGFVVLLAIGYQATRPATPKICGSTEGPSVTTPRIQLKDGRHLAYNEYGVPEDVAKHKIVYIHGFDSCRHDVIAAHRSPGLLESKGINIVSFDRPGYEESDPHPSRTVKSPAFDIEELADQLGLGSKFYVLGFSMGGQVVWSCLQHIPHSTIFHERYLPKQWNIKLTVLVLDWQAYKLQPVQDQWALRVSHYLPWLTYWWNSQKLFPPLSVIMHSPRIFSCSDKELLPKILAVSKDHQCQDNKVNTSPFTVIWWLALEAGEFDPTEIKNPFPNGEGSVHLWQGDEDVLVPVTLQRHIASQLPWIQYHELPGDGYMFLFADGRSDSIIQALIP